MPQDPWKVDQIQIEPGAAGTRLINRAADGSIQFTDAILTGGITLSQLAGLKAMQNVLIVGKGGAGAGYTTIQSALDTIPASSSILNPYFVFVGPGVYKETVNIVRDGVFIFGYGATLKSLAEDTPDGPGAYHTLVIQAALGTIPKQVVIIGLTVTNAHSAYACVRVVGGVGSQVGLNGILLQNCSMLGTNRTLWADSVDVIRVEGGYYSGSNPLSLFYAKNCAVVAVDGVNDIPNIELDYDTAGNIPSIPTSSYRINGCGNLGWGGLAPAISSTLTGAGGLIISGCSGGGSATFAGNRAVNVLGSQVGAVALSGTTALKFSGSQHGIITPAGTPTLAEPFQRGTVVFAAVNSMPVAFPVAQPDNNYGVSLETSIAPAGNEAWWVTARTAAGFILNFTNPQTLTAVWSAQRSM